MECQDADQFPQALRGWVGVGGCGGGADHMFVLPALETGGVTRSSL